MAFWTRFTPFLAAILPHVLQVLPDAPVPGPTPQQPQATSPLLELNSLFHTVVLSLADALENQTNPALPTPIPNAALDAIRMISTIMADHPEAPALPPTLTYAPRQQPQQ
jgi:hypothetical protein